MANRLYKNLIFTKTRKGNNKRYGDYLLPDITLSDPQPELTEPLGRYARMRRAYLQEHRPILYSELLLTERLYSHLREIDKAARNRLAAITDRETAHEIIVVELICD
jgi:hypothetical protein